MHYQMHFLQSLNFHSQLLTKTISNLASKQFAANLNGKIEYELKQMACFRNSLTKQLVFRKKVVSNVEPSGMSRCTSFEDIADKNLRFVSYQPECSSDDDDETFVTSEN